MNKPPYHNPALPLLTPETYFRNGWLPIPIHAPHQPYYTSPNAPAYFRGNPDHSSKGKIPAITDYTNPLHLRKQFAPRNFKEQNLALLIPQSVIVLDIDFHNDTTNHASSPLLSLPPFDPTPYQDFSYLNNAETYNQDALNLKIPPEILYLIKNTPAALPTKRQAHPLELITPYRTLTGSYPTRGLHLAFSIDPEISATLPRHTPALPNIDFITKNKIMASPSVHRSNQFYLLKPLTHYLPPTPTDLLNHCLPLAFEQPDAPTLNEIHQQYQKASIQLMLNYLPPLPPEILAFLQNQPKAQSIYQIKKAIKESLNLADDATQYDSVEHLTSAEYTPDQFDSDEVAEPTTDIPETSSLFRTLKGLCDFHPPAIQGQNGNFTTYILATKFYENNIHPQTALNFLNIYYNPRCEPEWSIEELSALVANAYTYAKNKPAVAQQLINSEKAMQLFQQASTEKSAHEADIHHLSIKEVPSLPEYLKSPAHELPIDENTSLDFDDEVPLDPDAPVDYSGKTYIHDPRFANLPPKPLTSAERYQLLKLAEVETFAETQAKLENERAVWYNLLAVAESEKTGARFLDPRRVQKNLPLLLKHLDDFKNLIGYSEFDGAPCLMRPSKIFERAIPSLTKPETFQDKVIPINDRIMSVLKNHLENYDHFGSDSFAKSELLYNGFSCSQQAFQEGMLQASYESPFNPVRDKIIKYFLEWDFKPRLDDWFPALLSLPPSQLNREIGSLTLSAIICRVINPGHKYDYCVVLEGKQGVSKSSIPAAIAMERRFFLESHIDIENPKNILEQTQGKLVVELPELVAMARNDDRAMKKFITDRFDKGRLSYARFPEDIGRKFVVFGTTNESTYLTDTTGGRRYLPVKVTEVVDVENVTAHMPHLYAEAFFRILQARVYMKKRNQDFNFMRLELTPKAEYEAHQLREGRMLRDHRCEKLIDWFDGGFNKDMPPEDCFIDVDGKILAISLAEVARSFFGMKEREFSTRVQGEYNRLLISLGWEKKRIRLEGRQIYYYLRHKISLTELHICPHKPTLQGKKLKEIDQQFQGVINK